MESYQNIAHMLKVLRSDRRNDVFDTSELWGSYCCLLQQLLDSSKDGVTFPKQKYEYIMGQLLIVDNALRRKYGLPPHGGM